MTEPPRTFAIAADATPAAPIHRFAHVAMNATFEVLVAGQEEAYAGQAAEEAFEELDRLHNELNRFDPTSDVSRTSALKAGQYIHVGLATLECLVAAARASAETGGAFDPTVGSLLAAWRNPDKSPRTPSAEELAAARARTGMHLVDILQDRHAVGLLADGVKIDLGGIGKGYAVDQMVAILREWSIEAALVHGGHSSVMAIGAPPGRDGWPVSLSGTGSRGDSLAVVHLRDRSLSGSASPPGDRHIIDPRSGRPAEGNLGAWAVAGSATLTDCLSTAFLVMAPDEVKAYCAGHADVSAMLLAKDSSGSGVLRFGKW
jgi:thiamine biosynthesis lipoprotein